ncbi:precorrin-3B synthase [Devosia rhizoryzae]|uniref:Precorrin-3B synthase n=1 Tax=Devosia rhizoryzae TaxID=2774137 RepID=A0ABX7C5W4_9HYPH|nr:precorrin-3B synthase [Devosia rhizoryzae]QQR38020.1 precorrin-3B synthase [Devosia rhizoryzae]
MAQALDIANFGRRSACPTLDAPMQTGDGLLARVRIAGGRLRPRQLAGLVRLAMQHGNGVAEVTARGNLQVRGLSADSSGPFAGAVTELVPVETGLVIDVSPIAGEDPEERADPRHLAQAIRAGVEDFEHRLGPKVSVVVDGGGQISLAALKADVRLLAVEGGRWSVQIGRGAEETCDAGHAVAVAVETLARLAAMGPGARAGDLPPQDPHPASPVRRGRSSIGVGVGSGVSARGTPPPSPGGGWVGVGRGLGLLRGTTTPIALPFGVVHAEALLQLAEAANDTIRLAPGHMLLLDNASPALIETAESLGFITRGDDPRLRISACIGSDGCASGLMPARRLAARLATQAPTGKTLHVSGCGKGCAHPRPADVALVGRADGIGLVIDGRAGDTPVQVLDEAGILPAFADLDRR